MNRLQEMPPERLEALLANFPQARIAVIGDFFLDKYLDVDPAWRRSASKPARRPTRWSPSAIVPERPERWWRTWPPWAPAGCTPWA